MSRKEKPRSLADGQFEGRDDHFMDIDRMVNEGLGGGRVSDDQNGLVGDTTTDTMDEREE